MPQPVLVEQLDELVEHLQQCVQLAQGALNLIEHDAAARVVARSAATIAKEVGKLHLLSTALGQTL